MIRSLIIILITILSIQSHADTITIGKVQGEKEELIRSILALALDKASPATTLKELEYVVPEGRLLTETNSGKLDVMWAGSSATLDESLLAVRIPLLKGMLGHRIFIIRGDDQDLLADVKNLSDLKQFKAGMGRHWGSTKVLQEAGLPVVTSVKYDSLFHMLDGDRFDYFPRALHEPWGEVQKHSDLDLGVDSHVMLIYPYAMYFYVRKDNTALHARLTAGLEEAIADGSFDQLFFSNPMVRQAVDRTGFKNRVVIRLPNSAMHPDTPVDRPELWLDVSNL